MREKYLSLNKCLIVPPPTQKVAFFFDSNGDQVDPAHVDASGVSPDGSFFYKKFRKKDSKTEIWEVEKHILRTLEKNFVNEPKIKHYPFPKLIDTDEVKLVLKMSYCGESPAGAWQRKDELWLGNPSDGRALFEFSTKNVKNTIDCIVNNLLLNNIIYFDIHYENVCVNEKGHLHLIDFGAPARLSPPDQSATERERMCAAFEKLSSDILLAFES